MNSLLRPLFSLLITAAAALCLPARAADLPKVLFFTKASAYQHEVTKRVAPDEMSLAEKQLLAASKAAGAFELVASQDPSEITPGKLAQYAAVAFYTSGDLPIDKEALIDYVKGGGGFACIHNGLATLMTYAPYGQLVGAEFDGHPWDQIVTVKVEDPKSPATQGLGASFSVLEEIYQVKNFDRNNVHMLLSLDNSSVDLSKGHRPDQYYPLSWTRDFGKGKVFYSAFGHHAEVWNDERMLKHFVEGIRSILAQK
jgi:uncharacterized protein